MQSRVVLLLVLSLPLACDSKESSDAKTSAPKKAAADNEADAKTNKVAADKNAEANAKDKADAEAGDADPSARVAATMKDHIPAELQADITPTKDGKVEKFGLVQVTAPDKMKVKGGIGDKGEIYEVTGLAAPVGVYAHNPAGDTGADCPTLEDVKKAIGSAEIDAERRLSTSWDGEGPMYGNEIDFLVFHDGDKSGFYMRHRFDHGDDYTDFCIATGTPQAPQPNASSDDVKVMAGVFATAREDL